MTTRIAVDGDRTLLIHDYCLVSKPIEVEFGRRPVASRNPLDALAFKSRNDGLIHEATSPSQCRLRLAATSTLLLFFKSPFGISAGTTFPTKRCSESLFLFCV